MEKEFIIINENVFVSILKDIATFGSMFLVMYFNHKVLSGSTFVDFLFIVMIFMFLGARSSKSVKKFDSREEALKYLEGKK